ncbi:MAG: protein-L-isoaspartate(D-aspartate) O-methyltransferase [Deltaproteobacteria bacterium]|nr:protein-L-isoaspartate(D-aspartate) O-methyltransferase [Deltaproteobacteria bacterium]
MDRPHEQTWPPWIAQQLVRRGIHDPRVLRAFAEVPRSDFVGDAERAQALVDSPLPIDCNQTVSQPYVIALSLQALRLKDTERVLDVGTGSGFQAVLLSHLAREVFSVEVHMRLFTHARLAIERRARAPVHTRHANGALGWPEAAPFDAIVAGCFAQEPPPALLHQLAPGGRMVIPLGNSQSQTLILLEKLPDGSFKRGALEQVIFVPMLGVKGSSSALG